ncbi:YfcC family protein, partial [Nocardioides guangzhouensis]
MSDQTAPPPPAAPAAGPRFRLPSAYTILFALIVVMAIATWIIPAGAYQLDKEGAPIPGTYHEVAGDPQRILIDSLTAPINGLYGIEDA